MSINEVERVDLSLDYGAGGTGTVANKMIQIPSRVLSQLYLSAGHTLCSSTMLPGRSRSPGLPLMHPQQDLKKSW